MHTCKRNTHTRKRFHARPAKTVQQVQKLENHASICMALRCIRTEDALLMPCLCSFIPLRIREKKPVCPLLLALELDRMDLIGVLLQRGADPEREPLPDLTALHCLLVSERFANDPMRMSAILRFPPAALCQPRRVASILFTRNEARDLPVLEAMIAAKADVNDTGGIPLSAVAARENNAKMLETLLRAGARVSVGDVMFRLLSERVWLRAREWSATLELLLSAGPCPLMNWPWIDDECATLVMFLDGVYARFLAGFQTLPLPPVLASLVLDYFGKQWYVRQA